MKNRNDVIQKTKVLEAIRIKPLTMKEIDIKTGVMRENVCRHINTLLEENKIAEIRKRKCTITGHNKVMEYTANPDLFPPTNQLDLPFIY